VLFSSNKLVKNFLFRPKDIGFASININNITAFCIKCFI